MPDTRRSFFQAAAVAAGLSGAALEAQAHPPQESPQRGAGRSSPGGASPQPSPRPRPASEVQVPKMKFGNAEISRLICGCNTFYGYAHFNQILGTIMQEYYTQERVCDVLHQCNRFGINAFNFHASPRGIQDFDRFVAEGGRMHLVVQGQGDQTEFINRYKPLAIYYHGEQTDRAFQNGRLDDIREWCKKMRGMGMTAGVGTHKPEVIAEVESRGWDVDFYAGCVYNRTRTREEWKQVLGGEVVEMQGECYIQSDPARMYKVMRATRKPCFAFKILAAGRVANAEQAFRTAFESIKPIDGVFVGLFPRVRDEVRENAERVHRILAGA